MGHCCFFPKKGGGFILDTDAAEKAIGAVLSQLRGIIVSPGKNCWRLLCSLNILCIIW